MLSTDNVFSKMRYSHTNQYERWMDCYFRTPLPDFISYVSSLFYFGVPYFSFEAIDI